MNKSPNKIKLIVDKHKTTLLLLPILVLMIGAVIVGLNVSNRQVIISSNSSVSPSTQVLGVSADNEQVVLRADHLRVNSPDPNLTNKTKKVTLLLSITNKSDEVLEFSPGLTLQLLDSAGNSYQPTMKFVTSDVILGGPIGPGKNMTLDVDFEIPLGSATTKLIFQKDPSASEVIVSL